MGAGRLLLIENLDHDAHLIQSVFQDIGVDVVRVSGGSDGLELASSFRPNIVILTDDLPDISGYMVCGQLKRSEEFANIPVILTSAKDSAEQMFAKHAEQPTRADAYLTKPLNAEQLLDAASSVGFLPANNGDLTPAPQRMPSGAMLGVEVTDDVILEPSEGMVSLDSPILDMDVASFDPATEEVVDVQDDDFSVSDAEAEAFIREATSVGHNMAPMSVEVDEMADMAVVDDLDAPAIDDLGESLGLGDMLEDLEVSSGSTSDGGLDSLLAQHPTADGDAFSTPAPAPSNPEPHAQHEVQALKQEVSRLQALLAEQESPKALESKLREAEQERDALRDVEATQEQTIRRLRDDIERLQEGDASTQARLAELEAHHEQSDHTVQSLRAERDDAQRKLTDVVVQNRGLKSQVKDLSDELEALRAQMMLSRDEMDVQAQALEEARAHASRSHVDASQSLEIIASLRADLQRPLSALEASLGND